LDLNADPAEMAKRIVAQSGDMEKWQSLVKAEQETLKSELENLGLW
jgi:hypothetical protein